MEPLTLQRIERAIRIVAGLIAQTGEDFWPVLDRLERERDALAARETRLARYLEEVPGKGQGREPVRARSPR